jgi:hypothetical protein
MSQKEIQIQPAVQPPQVIPFRKMGDIRMANNTLKAMNSPYRVGNLMNPALRQSMWDTSNLTGVDPE